MTMEIQTITVSIGQTTHSTDSSLATNIPIIGNAIRGIATYAAMVNKDDAV